MVEGICFRIERSGFQFRIWKGIGVERHARRAVRIQLMRDMSRSTDVGSTDERHVERHAVESQTSNIRDLNSKVKHR